MTRVSFKKTKTSEERMFEIIRRPVVTEKATLASEYNQFTFQVPLDASKCEVKESVERLFKVKVVGVNTLRQQGKLKRFRNKLGKRCDYKKAIVTLAEGQSIDLSTGV
ncbi:MAG: 50S ribosomal protein L23 [Alphaproteobacteria bacterium MarineAlpha3_Bin5]|nr:50S ribosomal protein L23 [Magnetovibrio sp.]PPR76798.1 MAG: 50S ribosomal protein L23 [Alphaproteobacteria bacterium MarineAlpha3_Bin5]